MAPTHKIGIKVLPGEPTDGSGRACIHLFVIDEKGPFVEPHVLHPALDDDGMPKGRELVAHPTRGRLACDPKKTVAPVKRGGVVNLTFRTDCPQAVTCPKCLASDEYKAMTAQTET